MNNKINNLNKIIKIINNKNKQNYKNIILLSTSVNDNENLNSISDINKKIGLLKGKNKMKNYLIKYKEELSKLRADRADPTIFDNLKIDAYGKSESLNKLAQISLKTPKLMIINVYDESLSEDIVNIILNSNFNLTPQIKNDKKNEIHIPIPKTTKETRDEHIKTAKLSQEKNKQSILGIRKELMNELKKIQNKISEDDNKIVKDKIEKLSSNAQKKSLELFENKQKELSKE